MRLTPLNNLVKRHERAMIIYVVWFRHFSSKGGAMRKKTFVFGVILVLTVAWCMTAYAADASNSGWHSFFGAIGGFFYNALPWNWGNWFGK